MSEDSSEATTETSEISEEASESSTGLSELYADIEGTESETLSADTEDVESEEQSTTFGDLRDRILKSRGRHLKAEEENWAVCPVDSLENICIKYIAEHFLEVGVTKTRDSANDQQWQEIMKRVPLDLPDEILLPVLDDEIYWKRRCLQCWGVCDVSGKTWRQLYAERCTEEAIESFIPNTNPKSIDKVKKMCKEHVIELTIRKLQLVSLEEEEEEEEEEENEDEEEEMEIPFPYSLPDHTNVGEIFLCFPKLKDITICLVPEDCGLDYVFTNYELTPSDGQKLAENLKKMPKLKSFRFCGSHASVDLVKKFCDAFESSSCLNVLDLSYNILNFNHCIPISQLLMSSCTLRTLILSCNAIGDKGLTYLGAALTENSKLKDLSVKLNGIGDEAGEFFAKCLERNSTLESLDVSANFLAVKSGFAFARLIEISKSLKILDLSSNSMGRDAGVALKLAIEKNNILQECDVRLCDLGDGAEIPIRDYITRNCNKCRSQDLT